MVFQFEPGRCAFGGGGSDCGEQRARAHSSPRLCTFQRQRGALAEADRAVRASQAVRFARCLIVYPGAAKFDGLGHTQCSVDTANPGLHRIAAIGGHIDFVGHTNRDRVHALVERRDRSTEQNPSGKRLELVVGQSRHRLRLEQDGWLIAIACDDLDAFTAAHAVWMAHAVRAGQAECGDLVDYLPQRRVTCKASDGEASGFHARLHAGQGAIERAEPARVAAKCRGDDVAEEAEAATMFDLRVEAVRTLRIEHLPARVACDGIVGVWLDVTEQRRARVLFRVICDGNTDVAGNLSPHEQGAAARVATATVSK